MQNKAVISLCLNKVNVLLIIILSTFAKFVNRQIVIFDKNLGDAGETI